MINVWIVFEHCYSSLANKIRNIMMCFVLFFRIIMEADSSAVVQRVALRTDDIPLGEQTVAQV